MKANDGRGNTPKRDTWQTPSWIFDPLNEQYSFDFDCCADEENRKVFHYADNFENHYQIRGIAWMNPPFSKARKMFEHFFKVVRKGVAIYRCDNFETMIWQRIIFPRISWIFIPDRRVAYDGLKGTGVRFPSALIGYNVEPPRELNGTLLFMSH